MDAAADAIMVEFTTILPIAIASSSNANFINRISPYRARCRASLLCISEKDYFRQNDYLCRSILDFIYVYSVVYLKSGLEVQSNFPGMMENIDRKAASVLKMFTLDCSSGKVTWSPLVCSFLSLTRALMLAL